MENTTTDQRFVNIPRWDFHWQQLSFFSRPIWDSYSSRTVTWGEGTEDERCLNYFYVTVP